MISTWYKGINLQFWVEYFLARFSSYPLYKVCPLCNPKLTSNDLNYIDLDGRSKSVPTNSTTSSISVSKRTWDVLSKNSHKFQIILSSKNICSFAAKLPCRRFSQIFIIFCRIVFEIFDSSFLELIEIRGPYVKLSIY